MAALVAVLGLVTVFGALEPDPWASATEDQRERGEINRDTCVLPMEGTTHYFVRGELQIPVVDSEIGVFAWSVWVSRSLNAGPAHRPSMNWSCH